MPDRKRHPAHHRPRIDPARVAALRQALTAALDAGGGEAFLYRSAGEHLKRAVEGLNHFGATGNTLVLRDSIVAGLALLQLALQARRLDGHEQLVDSNKTTVTLDAATAELVENAARSGGVTAAEVVRRAVAFYAGPILGALAEAQK